jgi:Mn-containing catalase
MIIGVYLLTTCFIRHRNWPLLLPVRIAGPHEHVQQTKGLLDDKANGTHRTEESVQKDNMALSGDRKAQVDEAALPENGVMSWSVYEEQVEAKSNKS